jgi:hypothetical protein
VESDNDIMLSVIRLDINHNAQNFKTGALRFLATTDVIVEDSHTLALLTFFIQNIRRVAFALGLQLLNMEVAESQNDLLNVLEFAGFQDTGGQLSPTNGELIFTYTCHIGRSSSSVAILEMEESSTNLVNLLSELDIDPNTIEMKKSTLTEGSERMEDLVGSLFAALHTTDQSLWIDSTKT